MKQITIEKNYNNKLNCNVFFHLALVPTFLPSFEKIRDEVFEIFCKDGSITTFKARILEVHKLNIWKVPESATMISHEMEDKEFIEYMYQSNSNIKDKNDFEIGLYVYQKILT